MITTPWPLVSFVCRSAPTPSDPRGLGVPGPETPANFVDVNAIVRAIVTPTRLVLVVLSFENFLATADEFDAGQPRSGTYKRLGPTLLSETFVAVDPPSIAAGAQFIPASPFAIPGAAMGDTVQAAFSLPLQGMTINAEVVSTGFANIVVKNGTAAAINLGSGTLRLDCWKH